MKLFLFTVLLFFTGLSFAQKKAALVVGNNDYKELPLKNAVNDANLMEVTLQKLGFTVQKVVNTSKSGFEKQLLTFIKNHKNADVRFFYYAGHGIQIDGKNFLVPVDASLDERENVTLEGLDFSTIFDQFQNSRTDAMNIFVIDACRNNPFKNRSWGSRGGVGDRGLVLRKADFTTGSFAAFAADNGQVASDGNNSDNGLYTKVLSDELLVPGLELNILFQKVRGKVIKLSNGEQTPVEENRLISSNGFYFIPPVDKPTPSPSPAPVVNSVADYTETAGSLNIEMVAVKGGTFTMGSPASEPDRGYDEIQHQVTLSDFYIGKYEVTQAQWEAVMGNNPSSFKGSNRPVEFVSWNDIQAFLFKLNTKTGKKYRLPTEAEWEYAARGGNKSQRYMYSGGDYLNVAGWFKYNSDNATHPVGERQANELGVYDMSGNVWEWCNDWYGDYSTALATNPLGAASGSSRVLRGGSWMFPAKYCRSANRAFKSPPTLKVNTYGFRLALGSSSSTKDEEVIINDGQAIKVTFESGILFATNSSTLNSASQSVLTSFATSLTKNPDTNVILYGYTDSTENNKLSIKRAQAVANFLMSKGVGYSRMITQGVGSEQPIADNSTAIGRTQNRRVEVYILPNEKKTTKDATLN
ncbi:SUMF1/EgtB/PvdO family nonheme iron enzyme [Dysgonomonas termitidis]|uniref:SUMF1/EgtB/PvdO family nonheme iron enzyme n=1 Tax=Dysgonomonas termitidis TaxID=1516126 RepID=A0ABV9KS53_9BACT